MKILAIIAVVCIGAALLVLVLGCLAAGARADRDIDELLKREARKHTEGRLPKER